MSSHLILDTGPWVALHCHDDAHHAWEKTQFAQHAGPFLTCEAVVAETCFLLARSGFNPGKALMLIERGVVKVAMSLADKVSARYAPCLSATTTCPRLWPMCAWSACRNFMTRVGW